MRLLLDPIPVPAGTSPMVVISSGSSISIIRIASRTISCRTSSSPSATSVRE